MKTIKKTGLAAPNTNDRESPLTRQSFLGTPEGDDWRLFKPKIDDDGAAYDQLRQLLKLDKADALSRLSELARSSRSSNGHVPRRPPKLPHLWPPKLLHLAGVS